MERFEKVTFPRIMCIVCEEEIPIYHTGIRGSNDHHICQGCSKSYLSYMLDNPQTAIPAKGSNCSENIEFHYLECNMDKKQMLDYLKYLHYKKDQYKNKKIVSGVHCSYLEYWDKEDKSTLFFGKKLECRKARGLVGGNDFAYPQDPDNLTDQEKSLVGTKDWIDVHAEGCAKHMEHIEKIKEILHNGNKRVCPTCGLSGRKDEKCTHITCSGCKKRFCYFGGISEEKGDKSRSDGNIYQHNDNWQTDVKRCPLFIKDIWTFDSRWPKDDTSCQDFLHKILVFIELRNYADKIGRNIFESLVEKFPEISDYGYNFSDLFTMDLTLIKR